MMRAHGKVHPKVIRPAPANTRTLSSSESSASRNGRSAPGTLMSTDNNACTSRGTKSEFAKGTNCTGPGGKPDCRVALLFKNLKKGFTRATTARLTLSFLTRPLQTRAPMTFFRMTRCWHRFRDPCWCRFRWDGRLKMRSQSGHGKDIGSQNPGTLRRHGPDKRFSAAAARCKNGLGQACSMAQPPPGTQQHDKIARGQCAA